MMIHAPRAQTKGQLLASLEEEVSALRRRSHQQKRVIQALPDDVLVDKAYTTAEQIKLGKIASAHGFYEVTTQAYGNLRTWLAALPPVTMSRVEMERPNGREKSISFYPSARVPANWPDKHSIAEVAPFIWQASPYGSSADCRVSVEWFTEPAQGLFVLVRARVVQHDTTYRAWGSGGLNWTLRNYPAGQARFVKLVQGAPPFATVWWSRFGPENTTLGAAGLDSLVAHLEGGPRQ